MSGSGSDRIGERNRTRGLWSSRSGSGTNRNANHCGDGEDTLSIFWLVDGVNGGLRNLDGSTSGGVAEGIVANVVEADDEAGLGCVVMSCVSDGVGDGELEGNIWTV